MPFFSCSICQIKVIKSSTLLFDYFSVFNTNIDKNVKLFKEKKVQT